MYRGETGHWERRDVARLLALLEGERHYYQQIVAKLPVGVLVLSSDLTVQSHNCVSRSILGAPEGMRENLESLTPPGILETIRAVLRTGEPVSGLNFETRSQPIRTLRVSVQAIHGWHDDLNTEALVVFEDLSAQAPLSKHLQDRAGETATEGTLPSGPSSPEDTKVELLTKTAGNLNGIIWTASLPDKRFVYVNEHAEEWLGYPASHWLSNPHFWSERIFAPDREGALVPYELALDQGKDHVAEFRVEAADKQVYWVREVSRIIRDCAGRPALLAGLTIDITERQERVQHAIRAERVSAVGKLASRIAHDVNNMLMIVNGYAEDAWSSLHEKHPLRGDLREILNATERAATLAGHLLAWTRRAPASTESVELNAFLQRVQATLTGELGSRIELRVENGKRPLHVQAAEDELQSAVEAVVHRAAAAMPAGGSIHVGVSEIVFQETDSVARATLPPGRYACIRIQDSGSAIGRAASLSLFDCALPSREEEGNLSALARGYLNLRDWGGDVTVESPANPNGSGNVFTLLLRRGEEEPSEETPATGGRGNLNSVPREQQTVLIVEDEPGIRALVKKILTRQDFRVFEAGTGTEALDLCKELGWKIDLLITDVMMPNMGGRELVERLRQECGSMNVLYVSGYTDDAALYSGELPSGTAFLQKPFTLGSLLEKVKEILMVKSAYTCV